MTVKWSLILNGACVLSEGSLEVDSDELESDIDEAVRSAAHNCISVFWEPKV